jgi:hypothetical protein
MLFTVWPGWPPDVPRRKPAGSSRSMPLADARRGLCARRHECGREEISMPFTGTCQKRAPVIVKRDAVRGHDGVTFVGFLAARLVDPPDCAGKASNLPEPAAKTAIHSFRSRPADPRPSNRRHRRESLQLRDIQGAYALPFAQSGA